MCNQTEYSERRSRVLDALGGRVALVFAGSSDDSLHANWRPHPHFEYLTGLSNEPDAVVLFDPTNPVVARRQILFLRALDPEKEQWDGLRKKIGSELRGELGFATIARTHMLPIILGDVAKRCKTFATLMPSALVSQTVSQDLAMLQNIAQNNPACEIADLTSVIPALRSVKSSAEIQTIQKAVDATAVGFSDAMTFVKGGVNEYQVQATLEHGYAMAGGRGSAFPPIVGGGINSTVLHYKDNDQDLVDGDLVCIDSGALYCGYGADISRTIPVNGAFSTRQKELYELVLQAEEAAIQSVKAGVTLAELDAIARAIITKAGFGDYFIHSIGHHLGLETHDSCGTPSPLKEGAVITIEPGIYIPEESIGIRIEDDIVVTKEGHKNLSKAIPKTVEDIERVMRG
ncbi:MAG: Xaa-Pro peptidase family protein [Phycisphaerales bacterium]|jgi:Xaa-Pro aminopeptidase|nr:Xaa-Pro peptidase family protein [Phycisphaerales bacterium]